MHIKVFSFPLVFNYGLSVVGILPRDFSFKSFSIIGPKALIVVL